MSDAGDVGPIAADPSIAATGLDTWATATPDRIAVCDVRRSMNFGELGSLADSLAAHLVEVRARRPVGTADWLPVVVDRSVEAAVALHGAVRAGQPFVPIEATLPTLRAHEMIARLGHVTHAVVARPEYARLLPPGITAIDALGVAPGHVDPVPVDGEAAGMVVFTSGSTGRPKGVVRKWLALDRRDFELVERGLLPADVPWRIGHLRPFSFAAGLGRITSMAHGHSVHVADPAALGADALLAWLDAQQVDNLSMGSTLAASILRASGGVRRLPHVRLLRLGTEGSAWELVGPLRHLAAPDVNIVTGFGATEASALMRFVIRPDDSIGTGRIPMGRPQQPWRIRLEPVEGEDGVTQLLLADPVGLEYLGDPELTAKRFVTDGDGMRWWVTGDIVDVDADGVYHHRGRIDEMVKINGVLVEPREAEEVLRAIPGIGNVAVLAHHTPHGAIRLVAHLRVDDDSLTPEAVRAHLEARLPRHLVPSMLVRHDELPANERGKLDRVGLQSLELVRWRSQPVRQTPVELEVWLAGQVARILDIGDVGPDDDIWYLGIDSLGAVELCAAIDDAGFGALEPTVLLTVRTPAALARRLENADVAAPSDAVVLNPAGERPPIFAIPGGGGTALAFQALSQALGVEQPLVVVEPHGLHRVGQPDRTLDGHVSRATAEIGPRLVADAPCVLLGFSAGGTVAYEIAQRMHRSGREVHLVLLDASPGSRRSPNEPAFRSRRSLSERFAQRREEGLLKAVPEVVGERVRRLRIRWLARFPGPPSHHVLRYQAFQLVLGRALAGYVAQPAAFPVTLVQVAGSNAAARCEPLMPRLTVCTAGGEHLTMLQPPHVGRVAEAVDAAIAAAYPASP